MASRGFGHASGGREFVHGSSGRGQGHQDFPLPEPHPLGITFSIVNQSRPTQCPQANIPALGTVISIFWSD